MKFNEILRYLREDRDLSQRELASILDVSAGCIGMYETGQREPSMEMEEKIAKFFNVGCRSPRWNIVTEKKMTLMNLEEDKS